jgi:hypothetical protein
MTFMPMQYSVGLAASPQIISLWREMGRGAGARPRRAQSVWRYRNGQMQPNSIDLPPICPPQNERLPYWRSIQCIVLGDENKAATN